MKKEDINTVEEENIQNNAEATSAEEHTGADNMTDDTEECDTVAEEQASETEEQTTKAEDELSVAKAEAEQWKTKYMYLQAEFDNYRKRIIREKANWIADGKESVISTILPIIDDFERPLKDESDDPVAIKEGEQLIFNKFTKTLERQGVKKIETADADFNVDYHEAIAQVAAGEDKKGKVIDCVQTGYTLNDKVIRFAKVAVGL